MQNSLNYFNAIWVATNWIHWLNSTVTYGISDKNVVYTSNSRHGQKSQNNETADDKLNIACFEERIINTCKENCI